MIPYPNYDARYFQQSEEELRKSIAEYESYVKKGVVYHPAIFWSLRCMRAELVWRQIEKESFGGGA